jgi:hypothetical protein
MEKIATIAFVKLNLSSYRIIDFCSNDYKLVKRFIGFPKFKNYLLQHSKLSFNHDMWLSHDF